MANSTGAIRDEIDRLDAEDAGSGEYILAFPVDLALVTAAADIVTDFIVGHKFEIVGKTTFVMTEIAVGAGGSVVLGLDLEGTEIGGLVTITEANGARAACLQSAAAISPVVEGTATSKITLKAKTVTVAHTSGKGVFYVRIKNVA